MLMNKYKLYIFTFFEDLKGSIIDLSIIIGIIALFQFGILQTVPEWLGKIGLGLLIVAIWLALFLRWLEIGIFPLWENLSQKLAKEKSKFWIILFAFVIGFATTVAEPALIAIAHKASVISEWVISAFVLRMVVALSVGFAIVIWVIRIITWHPLHWYIMTGYVLVIAITYFSPQQIVGLAFDSGGITTSTVTVPLIAALGIGLTSTIQGRNPILDGFGLIAFASLLPMIFVQLYGIFAYGSSEATAVAQMAETASRSGWWYYIETLLASIRDVLPVILVILIFYKLVLRKKIDQALTRSAGFILVVLGLYAFVIGLEMGLFPIGESLAQQLASSGSISLIYSFAFLIGFSTTIAEPALTAIARKAEEISDGSIKQWLLKLFVAFGVGIGILLGSYRIVEWDNIVTYIMIGYGCVIAMTFFAPRTIIPVAYDSGGVTTSTITVPIVAALGLGLATTIPWRNPLIDGFGLIAFASLFPMIAVLGYGITKRERIRMHEKKILSLEKKAIERLSNTLSWDLDGDGIDDQTYLDTLKMRKKKIITITGIDGAGISTVSRWLAKSLEYRVFSAGGLFRNLAAQQWISIEKLNQKASKNASIDTEIDALLRKLGEWEEVVLDARLGYYWIHDSFKVFLTVNPDIAAHRIFDDVLKWDRDQDGATSLDQAILSINNQSETTRQRYLDRYGVDISNTRQFNLIIDTSDLKPSEVIRQIKTEYRKWIQKGGEFK